MTAIPDILVHVNQIRQRNISRELIGSLRHVLSKTLGDLRAFQKLWSLGNNVHCLLFPFLSGANPSLVATIVKLLVARRYMRNYSFSGIAFVVIGAMINVYGFWSTNVLPPFVRCWRAFADVFWSRMRIAANRKRKR